REQAQQVLAQAKAGKDFGDLAKQYSEDPGSAKNGGDLGWAERSSFVAPFADALFGMHVGEIKGPVKTQFGYHIIRLDEIQPGKSKSFERRGAISRRSCAATAPPIASGRFRSSCRRRWPSRAPISAPSLSNTTC